MLKKLVFGLVAFARECWKVGIFWEIFVKFAVFELVTLTICIYFYNFYFPTCSFQLGPFFLPSWACFLLLRLQSYRNKIKTILAPSVNLQKWRLEYHQNHSRNTVILKLNGSRSKHWNLILKRSNDSLWTKLSGILAFRVMSSIDCIARTLWALPCFKLWWSG